MQIRKRFYTPAEARSVLAAVRGQLARLQATAEELRAVRQTLRAAPGGPPSGPEQARRVEARARELEAELQSLSGGLDEMEVEVKDLDRGLVDFPAMLRGREVCLCYQLGEPDLDSWHGIRDGFEGRRPIAEVPEHEWEWCN